MVWKKYWESKDKESIEYQFSHAGDERSELTVGKWVVGKEYYVVFKPRGFTTELLGEFKTKQEALSFARKWMKEHPKG